MAALDLDDLDHTFDDHPSMNASLEDFEEQQHPSPIYGLPSQHSGFKSELEESEADAESSSGEPWSPPGFRRQHSRRGSGWFRHDPYASRLSLRPSMSPSRSRQTSPDYQDARQGDEDITLAANIPLPRGTDSPVKERSPEPELEPEIKRDDHDADPSSADCASNCTF